MAVGDCAAWLDPDTGQHRRIEHWTAARDRPSTAVATLLAGDRVGAAPVPTRERAPYFWSDQYGVRIQFAGHARPDDQVSLEIGRADEASFLAVYRRAGQPVAARFILDVARHKTCCVMRNVIPTPSISDPSTLTVESP